MKKDDPLDHLVDVLEDSPGQHDLADLHELEAEALVLELVVGLRGLLVDQGELRVLRALEEVEVARVVLGVVDDPCETNKQQLNL